MESGYFFKMLFDIYWSGNVVDGMIDGDGVGFYISDKRVAHEPWSLGLCEWVCFKGRFNRGYPVGECVSFLYKFEGNWDQTMLDAYKKVENRSAKVQFSEFNGETCNVAISLMDGSDNREWVLNRRNSICLLGGHSKELADMRKMKSLEYTVYGNNGQRHTYTFDFSKELDTEGMKKLLRQHKFEDKDSRAKIALFYAEYLKSDVKPYTKCMQMWNVMNEHPWLAQATDIPTDITGQTKESIQSLFLKCCVQANEFVLYMQAYKNNNGLSAEEIKSIERIFMLTATPKYLTKHYAAYFPNGKYIGADMNVAWAKEYSAWCMEKLL